MEDRRSQRTLVPALEALGGTFEGIHRNHMLVRDGENRDSAWCSTGDDWRPFGRESRNGLPSASR